MDPDGAYSQLIRLQEGEKEDEGSSKLEVDKSGDNLNIDSHMARSSTQRTSFASRTSSASLQHSQSLRGLSGNIEADIEQGQLNNKNKPKRVSIFRLAKLNKPEVPVILLGSIAALVHGVVFPIFGFLFSSVINMFYKPPAQQREESRHWSLLYVGLGLVTLVVFPLQNYFFGIAGGKLIERIRSLSFEKIVHQEIRWFDDPANSRYVKMYFKSRQNKESIMMY
jgi:ATP-binding cassette subfamily B (MDR/TAP) protein 1